MMSVSVAIPGYGLGKHKHVASPTPVTTMSTLWSLVGLSLVALLCFSVAASIDSRELGGANVWLKPAKFALSFLVLYLTLVWVVQRMSEGAQNRLGMKISLGTMALATWLELGYIGARAGMAKHSHFAQGSPMEIAMYSLMGGGAVCLVVGIAYIGWVAGRDPAAQMGPGTQKGVKWGFAISAWLTLLTAGYLSGNGGHLVGIPSAQAMTIPLLGWSAEVGDLRPAHFLALHAMQALPMAGWWLDRRPQKHLVGRMRAFSALYVLLCAAVFAQAIADMPLLAL